jgi:phosphatidylglycerophosphate synthase
LTIAQVRMKAQDHPHLAADPTYGRVVMRRLSPYVTWLVVNRTGLGADAVTSLAILCGMGGALTFLVASPGTYLLGVLLLQLAYLLDTVDGEVARVRGTSSKRGTYLDLIGHVLQNRMLLGVTCFLFIEVAGYAWWALAISFAGLALGSPFGMLSRMQVAGVEVDVTEVAHGHDHVASWPSGGGIAQRAGWIYRRLAFVWNYPASMNFFCLAALADVGRFAIGGQQAPLVLPLFAGAFAATATVKQVASALRLLRRPLWEAR